MEPFLGGGVILAPNSRCILMASAEQQTGMSKRVTEAILEHSNDASGAVIEPFVSHTAWSTLSL